MHYIKYKEIANRGTAEFPLGYYHVNQMHPQYAMPYHWHDELEFIHIIKGSFEVMVSESSYMALAGDMLVVNSGFLHGGTPRSCIYECLVFPCRLLSGRNFSSSFLQELDMQNITLDEYYHCEKNSMAFQSMVQLFHLTRNMTTGYELIAFGLLNQVMGHMEAEHKYSHSDKTDLSKHKNIYLLKKVLNHIELHYQDKIGLDTLAKIAGMSSKYFCRFFFEMTGKTPIDYVNYYRIERACYLLKDSSESMTEVSLCCGFQDVSHFIKTFKKYKELTPGQYRKERIEKAHVG